IFEGILLLWISIAFATRHPILAGFATILFFGNLFLIGGGSKVDKLFLIYPYGIFLVLYGVGLYFIIKYWKIFQNKPLHYENLIFGMDPASFILWYIFFIVGNIVVVILSYAILFERNVISPKDWNEFSDAVRKFKQENIKMDEEQ
ncbi:MAG: hypothetical protein QXT62_03100, partial [Thermoplasmata archaeon]